MFLHIWLYFIEYALMHGNEKHYTLTSICENNSTRIKLCNSTFMRPGGFNMQNIYFPCIFDCKVIRNVQLDIRPVIRLAAL